MNSVGGFMKIQTISGRIVMSLLLPLVTSACSDVSFGTADAKLAEQLGRSGEPYSEDFTQGLQSKKLDILFVVDNSGSMAEEQEKMGTKIDSFLSTLYDVDWQVAITTTDVSDGQFGLKGDLLNFEGTQSYLLTKNTPNYMAAFENTITREESFNCTGNCASGDEQPLRAAIQAIEKRDTRNRGFFRDGADLGLLILSDEDEMSTGPANATMPSEVISTFNSAWQDSKKLLTYGMVIMPGDTTCFNTQGGVGHYGSFVTQLAILTSGLVGSICEDDYAPTLGLLANHARRLFDYVRLKYYPVIDSVEVVFTPAHTTAFHVEGKRLYFDNPPAKDTKISVSYIVK
jgi:hypothetical protein